MSTPSPLSPQRSLGLLCLIAATLTLYRIWLIGHLKIDAFVDEAQYWHWAKNLAWGYYSKPPMIAALIAASTACLGDTLLAIKLPSLLLYPLTSIALWCLTQKLFQNAKLSFTTGLAFLTMPLVSALGLFASTDAPLLFFWTLALIFFERTQHHFTWINWLAVGIFVGLGLQSKYTMLAFIGSIFLFLCSSPAGRQQLTRQQPWAALLIAALIISPSLIWNAENGFPTFKHTADITRLGERHINFKDFFEFLGAQWISLGPLLGGLAFFAYIKKTRLIWQTPALRLLAFMSVPLFILVCIQALTGRANGNWAAPIFIGALPLTLAVFTHFSRTRWLRWALTLNIAIAALGGHLTDLTQLADIPLTPKIDPFKRARGWEAFGQALSPWQAQYPQAIIVSTDRETLSELLFYARPTRFASWNPQNKTQDHYQLTTTLNDKIGQDLLFVSRTPLEQSVLSHFENTQFLTTIDIPVYLNPHRATNILGFENAHESLNTLPNLHRTAQVWLLQSFKGYTDTSSASQK